MRHSQKIIIGLMGALMIWISPALAQTTQVESPEALINQVYNDIRVANGLTAQAVRTLRTGTDNKSKEVAIHLYVEAGKLFEKSHRVLKALGPEHVPQADIDGSFQAMQTCIETVNRIKQQL